MYQNNIEQKNSYSLVSSLETKVREAGLVCLLGLAACSVAPVSHPVTALPPKPAEPVVESPEPEMDPGRLLKLGLDSFTNEDYKDSADFFNRAMDTGHLNDAGRALAYWHLGIAYRIVGDGRSSDAFDSFILVAEDIIDMGEVVKFAEKDGKDFVERFDLRKRIRQAWTLLNSTWAKQAPYFGRSLENPVPVQSMSELEYFLELVNNCPQAPERTIEELPLEELQGSLHHVILNCDSEEFSDEFYFQLNPGE